MKTLKGGVTEKSSKTATDLKAMINEAIGDLEITPSEYQRIMDFAHQGVLGKEDQALLSQFQQMLDNGTLTRVPEKA